MIYVNSLFVTNTSQNFYNLTGLQQGTTHTISTRTVDTTGNINTLWVNDPATTVILPVISGLSGNDITRSSITLAWGASDETYRVYISRNGVSLGNVSGSYSYIDNGLNSGTTYTYTLVPYNMNGIAGNSVSSSFTTLSGSSGGGGSSRKSSSTGGGGGAASVEDLSNIVLKEINNKYLRTNSYVTYEFKHENNPIRSIRLYSLKNSGEITSTIEC